MWVLSFLGEGVIVGVLVSWCVWRLPPLLSRLARGRESSSSPIRK
jgi:hypothetical protein